MCSLCYTMRILVSSLKVVKFFLDYYVNVFFFFSSRRRHTRYIGDWSSDVCSSDLGECGRPGGEARSGGPEMGCRDSRERAARDPLSQECLQCRSRRTGGPPGTGRQRDDALLRSEERRVGKEGRSPWQPRQCKEKSR